MVRAAVMSNRTTPEGRVEALCLRYLEKRRILAWNNPSGAVRLAPARWVHFGKKGSMMEDLKKVAWYLQRRIEKERPGFQTENSVGNGVKNGVKTVILSKDKTV
jgi:hypothetical protein